MNQHEKIRQRLDCTDRAIAEWPARIDALRSRGMTQKDFCAKHRLSTTLICHVLAGRRLAQPDLFKKVETALQKEKV